MTRGNSENRQVFARMQGMELPVLWAGLISFIHVLSEIANELIAAASGACICWCPMSPIDRFLLKRIWISQTENVPYKFLIITSSLITITGLVYKEILESRR